MKQDRLVLEWTSATVLTVRESLASQLAGYPAIDNGRLQLTLPNGVAYDLTARTPTVDSAVVGEGGLPAAPGASGWYYCYLVPSAQDPAVLVALGSTVAPTTGPAGYPSFVYIGCALFLFGGAGWWRMMYQGNRHYYTAKLPLINAVAGNDAALVYVGLGATLVVPPAAQGFGVTLESELTLAPGTGVRVTVGQAVDNGITPAGGGETRWDVTKVTDAEVTYSTADFCVPRGVTPGLWYKRDDTAAGGSTATLAIYITWFIDPYLA